MEVRYIRGPDMFLPADPPPPSEWQAALDEMHLQTAHDRVAASADPEALFRAFVDGYQPQTRPDLLRATRLP